MKLNNLISKMNESDNNLLLMVGIPLSGKSTLIKEIKLSVKIDHVISRDDLVLELSNGLSYTEAFLKVNQKEVSHKLRQKINEISKGSGNVIIDMTNLKPKSRRSHLKKFPNHNKIAVIVNIPDMNILLERNNNRNLEEGKFIPMKVIEDMLKSYSTPTKEEGFNHIVYVK